MNLKTLQEVVNNALSELYRRDFSLLEDDISENAIAHRMACYLQNYFDDLSVDFEYNGNVFNTVNHRKQLDGGNVKPDIIVHERLSNARNTLIIEVKKTSNKDGFLDDEQRVLRFTSNSCDFKYEFGLCLILGAGKKLDGGQQRWYQDGYLLETTSIESVK